jgi:hypothetical protein
MASRTHAGVSTVPEVVPKIGRLVGGLLVVTDVAILPFRIDCR